MSEIHRLCSTCSEPFSTSDLDCFFCSVSCQKESEGRASFRKETGHKKLCPICGVQFSPRRSDAIYCGKRCSNNAQNRKRIEASKKDYPLQVCDGCDKIFKPLRWNQRNCSSACFELARLKKEKADRRHQKNCQHCGKLFVTRNSKKIFCSQQCLRSHHSTLEGVQRVLSSEIPDDEKERRISRLVGPERDPTKREIREACLEIQKNWSEEERLERAGVIPFSPLLIASNSSGQSR